MVEDGVIEEFIPMMMDQDSETVFNSALLVLREIQAHYQDTESPLAGICTFCELAVPTVARLCEALGLPSSPSAAVDTARDKHMTRAAMKRAGLASPANFRVENVSELGEAVAVVGFPAVLKPISGAASLGVKKVLNEGELVSCYKEVVREITGAIITSGALVKADPSHSQVSYAFTLLPITTFAIDALA